MRKTSTINPKTLFDKRNSSSYCSKIISRETVEALRKDVTAKCYGGDISRKHSYWKAEKVKRECVKQVM